MMNKMNVVFMGTFTYPYGMAATKRIQNAINALKEYPDIDSRVILQRQWAKDNTLSGVHDGIPYSTVMGDLFGGKMILALPLLYYKTIAALKTAFQRDRKNVIYFYGPIFLDSIAPLFYAQRLGYKIVFDVNEDQGLAKEVSRSLYLHMRSKLSTWFSLQYRQLASGIVVISSYLEKMCRELTHGKVPLHFMPISVDMDFFPSENNRRKETISLFYAGSFGIKDGLPVLLDAFDRLAERYQNVRLVLTGRGDSDVMEDFFARIEMSPHKDRIEYKGYLDEKDYYSLLNEVDIPCMTRVDLAFANAGFPFKLGEFLATGKPVIASRVSDVERYLVDQQNAMLVQAGSSEEVCEAVTILIENPELATAIGKEGREVAKKFFDYKRQGEELRNFLEKVCQDVLEENNN